MRLTVFAAVIVLSASAPNPSPARSVHGPSGSVQIERVETERVETVATVPPEDTFNEFLPEDRAISECISALPKPGCGSDARGGWRQGLILLAIIGGLSFIAWRVVRGARLARLSRTPDDTTVPADRGDDPAP